MIYYFSIIKKISIREKNSLQIPKFTSKPFTIEFFKFLLPFQSAKNQHQKADLFSINTWPSGKRKLNLLVSGIQANVSLPYPVKYRLKGLSFIFGKKGGVDLWETYLKANSRKLISDIRKVPVTEYDLIISNF